MAGATCSAAGAFYIANQFDEPMDITPKLDPVVVVGGGVMGSSIASALSERGRDVLLIDESHPLRSSWGDSRGLQNRYYGVFLDMVKRSGKLWHQLQAENQTAGDSNTLIYPCCNFHAQPKDGSSYKRQSITPIKDLTEVKERFKGLVVPPNCDSYLDPNCAIISAKDCVDAFQNKVERKGGAIRHMERVEKVDRQRKVIQMGDGEEIKYSKLVLASGPWTNKVLRSASLPLLPIFVSAELTLYARPKEGEKLDHYTHPNMPVTLGVVDLPVPDKDVETNPLRRFYVYCVPMLPGENKVKGVKIGVHMQGELMNTDDFVPKEGTSPSDLNGDVFYHRRAIRYSQPQDDEVDPLLHQVIVEFGKKMYPGLEIEDPLYIARCLYTSSTDLKFVIGSHPVDENVFVATGFRGEGFKFAPVVGECVAEMVLESEGGQPAGALTQQMRDEFSLSRFFSG